VVDGKQGLGALGGVLFRPGRFFAAVKAGDVKVRPFAVFVVTSAISSAGSGFQLASMIGQSALASAALLGAVGLLIAPLGWFIDVRVTHWAARLLKGEGTVADTKAVVGFGSAPSALALVPFANVPIVLWVLVARIRGLGVLHRLGGGRAVVGASASAVTLLILAIAAAMSMRVFVLEAFKAPSGSMFPSVEIGDHLFVTKSSYGVLEKTAPGRGDVVVFEYPEPNPGAQRAEYVKRVIGLPGDELEFNHGAPVINGWDVPRCRLGSASAALDAAFGDLSERRFEVFVEFLEGKAYLVAFEEGRDDGRQGPYRVKPGEFWVLGDNRNNSSDSRAWNAGRGGGTPFENLKGRARWLWMPPERAGIDLADAAVLPKSLAQLEPELKRCLAEAPDLQHSTPPPSKSEK
jgi:signal peptidase I